MAIIASAVGLSIPYLRSHDVGAALRSELRMVADVQQLVNDTRRAAAETRAGGGQTDLGDG